MRDVLVVDDSSTMRRILQRSLVGCGVDEHRIRVACNGAEALDAFRERVPGLTLCDVAMPVLDGVGLMERLQDESLLIDTTMIFVTSLATDEMRERLLSLGARDVIGKPFSPLDLNQIVSPYLAMLDEPAVERPTGVVEASTAVEIDEVDEDPADWLARVVRECVATSLERMAFTEPIELEEAAPLNRLLFVGQVNVGPEARGLVRVAATYEAATALSRLLVGEEPGLDDARRCDAMQEIANIVGGAILTAREADYGEVWQLGIANGTVVPPGHHGMVLPLTYVLDDQPERVYVDIVGLG